ncbi:hypothetical protein GGH12_001081 [Coemansia sp. RSA 1822]|nr:hypothetical protein GGF49_000696 [Coemansia sp. RSA 1853]KAJ2565997.1 hypothetical protein GGH12_001081 [Coemansia sp. RSA 1822]
MLAGGLELAAADVFNNSAMNWAADLDADYATMDGADYDAAGAIMVCDDHVADDAATLAAKVRAPASAQSAGMNISNF